MFVREKEREHLQNVKGLDVRGLVGIEQPFYDMCCLQPTNLEIVKLLPPINFGGFVFLMIKQAPSGFKQT